MSPSPNFRGRDQSSSPVLGPAGQRGETNFCFFFSPKRRPEPSPPRRAKVPAFQRQGSQPSWLAQGCDLGGARAEARDRCPFGKDTKGPQRSWDLNWQGCGRALARPRLPGEQKYRRSQRPGHQSNAFGRVTPKPHCVQQKLESPSLRHRSGQRPKSSACCSSLARWTKWTSC